MIEDPCENGGDGILDLGCTDDHKINEVKHSLDVTFITKYF